MKVTQLLVHFILFALFLCYHDLEAKVFKLYFLGGQSNMDGYGYVSDLPEELTDPFKRVMIYHGNTAPDGSQTDGNGVWRKLRPGHGAGLASDGKTNTYSDRFGVELTFARQILELQPNEHIAIIKYSRGGTSIDTAAAGDYGCWEPDYDKGNGVNQYDHFLATVRNAFSVLDIDDDGEADMLLPSGIVWMQGESDAAYSEEIALRYESSLRRLMDLIRAALRADDLPVAVGRISDSGQKQDGKVWDYGEVVRKAQANFVATDGHAALVTSTDEYKYSDPWHYDSEGYLDLGRQFADAIFRVSTPAQE
ncbi:MAG: sialate O-acetylesterase [Candidatus Neomarinimicrobiota bacterium]